MSGPIFEETLGALKQAKDSKSTLKVLISVRKQVDWPKDRYNIIKLSESGCLKEIVQSVLSPQKSIVNVCLSILGNCMMDRGCIREVVAQFNILSVLNQLLKKHGKDDSINGRSFRIISNMCQHRDEWANVLIDRKPQVVSHIVECLKKLALEESNEYEKVSDATILMALKSLRELVNSYTITPLVKKFSVLSSVGCLLIKCSEEWQKCNKHEKLILDIIKLLQKYSRYKLYDSIVELRSTPKGDSLSHLSSVLTLAPKSVVQIIMNLLHMSQLKSELPIPEISEQFMVALERRTIVKDSDGESIECLQCLCFLLTHPSNRNSDWCVKCVPLLIKTLQEFKTPTHTALQCCHMLLATLNKLSYNERLLLKPLSSGIIGILTEKLHWIVGASKTLTMKHTAYNKKRKIGEDYDSADSESTCHWKIPCYRSDVTFYELKEPRSSASSDEEFECHRRQCSNQSCKHEYRVPSPSTSSPESSPSRSVYNEYDSEDDYSPVCSEADSTEFSPNNSEGIEGKNNAISDHDEQFEGKLNEEDLSTNPSLIILKLNLLREIIQLIKAYIRLRSGALDLASEDLLIALIKCTQYCKWVTPAINTIEVVNDILESHLYLIPLLQTGFAENVYGLTKRQPSCSKKCKNCAESMKIAHQILSKLTCSAESGVGQGDIAHRLIRGDKDLKKNLVLSIPYVISKTPLLCRFMLRCGGLEVLLNLLKEDRNPITSRTLKVVSFLAAQKLHIANPRKLKSSSTSKILTLSGLYFDDVEREEYLNVVTFKCQDGTLVSTDRDFLVEKSDFFSGLLSGHFKESNQNEINFPNVRAATLNSLFHLLHHYHSFERDRTSPHITELELDTLLDVIALCDRFLLAELCLFLTDSVEKFQMSSVTVPEIYDWALQSGTNLLRVESVAYALVGDIVETERLEMFERLCELGYKDEVLGDIETMLLRYLKAEEEAPTMFQKLLQ